MQRAINDPRGLRLGAGNSDGAPVIYDPQDNVLIVRDTRPNAPDGGTVFKPDPVRDPDFVDDKFGWHESIFAPGQLADGPIAAPPSPPLPATNQGNTGVPGGPIGGSINTAPPRAAPGACSWWQRWRRQLGSIPAHSSSHSGLGHLRATRSGRSKRRPDRHPRKGPPTVPAARP